MMFGKFRNPFDQPYLTEGVTNPSDLLAQYSFLPLKHVFQKLAPKENVLLIGRRGVGKTMILRLFDSEMVAEIYRQSRAHNDAREYLLSDTVGIYLNLASPILRLKEFSGRGHDENWWRRAFADYFSYLALDIAIRGCCTLSSLQEWRTANRWKGAALEDVQNQRALAETLSQLSGLDDARNLDSLAAAISRRLTAWVTFLNRDSETPPTNLVQIGEPLYLLAKVLGRFRKGIRILLLIDQYEVLHSLSGRIDLRPVFNEAMYSSARGGTGVEFKIGTRRYSFGDLKLFDSQTGLEDGREVSFVDLDAMAVKYFHGFAAELLAKRLANVGIRLVPGPSLKVAQHYLPGLAPVDEAARLAANARESTRRALDPYLKTWSDLGVSHSVGEAVANEVFSEELSPLITSLTALYLTHWLGRRSRRLPAWVSASARSSPEVQLETLGVAMRDALLSRYKSGTAKARKSLKTRAADDLVSSWEETALFHLASAFKNQRKHFASFETISRISSNVALVFLQIMRTAWELQSLRTDASPSQPIAPEIQSEAVYSVSREWALKIGREYEHGVVQDRFLRALGANLRAVQMSPHATVPTPNGFSTNSDDPSPGQLSLGTDSGRGLLNTLVNSGLLEESEHQDKTRGRPRRRKYYVNRVLCPYFAITDKHIKDPFYVEDLSDFISSLMHGEQPPEIKKLLSPRTSPTPRSPRTTASRQGRLF
jgi:hypothetical protein